MNAMITNMMFNMGLPATFDIEAFLTNATAKIKDWGGLALILMGVILMLVAVFKIVSGLISHGKKQVSWTVCIIMFILGGALASFGLGADAWAWLQGIAEGGKNTIDDLGTAGGGAGPTIIHWFTR